MNFIYTKTRIKLGSFLIGLSALLCSTAICDSQKLSKEVETGLSWLPVDTETLFVTQAPYPKKLNLGLSQENNYDGLLALPFSILVSIEKGVR